MIKVGFAGCGHIGVAHAVALQQLSTAGLVDACLAATFDEDARRAENMARHQGGEAVGSLDALIDAVDVVWICTWTAGHLPAVEAAAAAGKAIFCEKPLAPTLDDARKVAAALERVPHQVGLVLRQAPVFNEMARRIHSGECGPVLATAMRDDQYFPIQGFYGSTWRKDVARAGGGTLIEHSIHDVDVLRWLLGDPIEVSARTAARFGYPGIEDTGAVLFAYADGSVAQLTSVWHQVLSRESGRHLEVFCENAALWTENDYLGPLHVQTSDGLMLVEGELPEWASHFTLPEAVVVAIAPYALQMKSFLDALAAYGGDATGHPPAREALGAHRLVDAAYRSAAAGGVPISVPDLG